MSVQLKSRPRGSRKWASADAVQEASAGRSAASAFAARSDRDDQEPLHKAPAVGGTATRQTRFEAFFR